MSFQFSARWRNQDHAPNPLTEALAIRRQSGRIILDLTVSNPTQCGLAIPSDWLRLLNQPSVLHYDPNPQGDLTARQAVAAYYSGRGENISPSDIFLTAGTSEGYTHLFKLLCDPGDNVLVPQPSYPLLETLASLEGIRLNAYPLTMGSDDADGNTTWQLDRAGLEAAITGKTRAVFIIQPNNPTGSILTADDAKYLLTLAEDRGLALVVDEVFADYLHGNHRARLLHSSGPLVFTLNGLSKLLGLPQLKLAWIDVNGPSTDSAGSPQASSGADLKSEAKAHLEWICDAYLSVGAAPQIACAELLRRRAEFQTPIRERLRVNLRALRDAAGDSRLKPLWPQGGWCVPVQCRGVENDEELVLNLLQTQGVLAHPGYFFDFESEDILVLSLLTEPEIFKEGVGRIIGYLKTCP